MAKCPKCGKEIDHLIYWVPKQERYIFRISEDLPVYTFADRISDTPFLDGRYECPECRTVIFTEDEAAEDFLRGK
jgi:hypothetical protein